MKNKTLVTYASKHGATAEVAKKIGRVLSDSRIQTDVLDVKDKIDLSIYNNVILGSAVYIGQWK